jgi:hypothetical protein
VNTTTTLIGLAIAIMLAGLVIVGDAVVRGVQGARGR